MNDIAAPATKTGFVYHELFMWHNTGNYAGVMPFGYPVQPFQHAEDPETKRRIRNLLEVAGLTNQLVPIAPRRASEQELLRVHTQAHIDRLRKQDDLIASEAGSNTPMGRGSFDIALLAAGGVIEAVDAVITGRVANAYALVRPPGHHALAETAMGFCLLGNAAIAARHAMSVRGVKRIAFVDWDVHHGNGTQAAFYDDPGALTISVHQDRNFPKDSGGVCESGIGAGEGFNINVPLPPGCGVGAYEACFERIVVPAIEAFEPELIIVPSGFDAGAFDPLGRQMMTSGGFRTLTEKLMSVAEQHCKGRIVMCHEGGYSAPTVPFMALAVIETLSGLSSGIVDPFEAIFAAMGQQELQPHQEQLINQIAATSLARLNKALSDSLS